MSDGQVKVSSTDRPHPFHIVDPSPWPLTTSLAAAATAISAAFFFKGASYIYLVVFFCLLLLNMGLWFKDVIKEATHEKAHTPIVKIGMRYGMLLFIMSEVMFFVAFFWAFFDASLIPSDAIGGVWPPPGIETIPAFDLPFLMTMILLLSGCSVTWAHHSLLEGHKDDVVKGLAITVFLGIVFSGFQVYEYAHAPFGFEDTVFASTFYLATGFHGFHVLVGTIFLAVCWYRAHKGHFTADDHFGFEAAAWYWHFVDVVWLFLFVAIYWLGG